MIAQPLSHDKKGGNFGRKFLEISFSRQKINEDRGLKPPKTHAQKREGAANGARTGKLREREREK